MDAGWAKATGAERARDAAKERGAATGKPTATAGETGAGSVGTTATDALPWRWRIFAAPRS